MHTITVPITVNMKETDTMIHTECDSIIVLYIRMKGGNFLRYLFMNPTYISCESI